MTIESLATRIQGEVEAAPNYRFAFWRRDRVHRGQVDAVTLKAKYFLDGKKPSSTAEAKESLRAYLRAQEFAFVPGWILLLIIKIAIPLIIEWWMSNRKEA